MSWIKRNLYFLLGSFVTVGLLALSVVYLLRENSANNQARDDLDKAYDELIRLTKLNPHPGRGNVDNIAAAKKQQGELRAFLLKASERFARIPPIPDSTNLTTEEFTAQLRRTIDQMQRDAAQGGVSLPAKYNFTFESIRPQVKFATNSLQLLAGRLGEVKTICDILFRAKINALDNLRRERVCPEDDPEKAPADYLDQVSVTNALAVLTPYEITFRSFSTELAGVIGGLASSPSTFIIKRLDIEPAAPGAATEGAPGAEGGPPAPMLPTPEVIAPSPGAATESFRNVYLEHRRFEQPSFGPRPAFPTPAAPAVAAPSRSASQLVVNESAFKVSLRVDLVKLKLPK
jgi:hypothetical protein